MILYGSGIPYEMVREDSMSTTLEMFRVADIKEVIDVLGIPVKKSGKKQDLIDRVVEFVTLFPEFIVDRLSLDEIELVRRLLSGEEIVADPDVATTFYTLVKLGGIHLWDIRNSDEVCRLVLSSEAEAIFGDRISGLIPTREHHIHRFARRWGSLCGILPIGDIVGYLNQLGVYGKVDTLSVLKILKRFGDGRLLMSEPMFNDGKGDVAYISQWSHVVGSAGALLYKERVVDGRKVQVNAYEPKRFGLEVIMGVGLPLFAPVTPNTEAREALQSVLQKYGQGKDDAEKSLLILWKDKQEDGASVDSLGKILRRLKYSTIDAYNKICGLATNYTNTLPFWRFLGKSSQEEMADSPYDSRRPPKLVAGPNMRAAGLDITPEMQHMFEQMMWESEMARRMPSGQWPIGKRVGRNDPCPCGSGKKFKNCCGR